MKSSIEQRHEWPKEYRKRQGQAMVARIETIKKTIPKRFKNKRFANFDKSRNPEGFDVCLEYAKSFPEKLKDGKGLFISGKVGSGKTHLVAAIADYIARILKRKMQIRIIFTTAINMLSEIKYSYDSKDTEETVRNFEECDLLIVDDLGPEKMTDWTNELFYKIIDTRYSNMRPIIITTNLTNVEIKNKLSERMVSRIYETCIGVQMKSKDYRMEKL